MTSNKFPFYFEKHPAKKGICPQCKKPGTFRFYQGLSHEFGKCDRINHCGYYNKPDKNNIQEIDPDIKNKKEPKTIYPEINYCQSLIQNQVSNFHRFCIDQLKIPVEHLEKWKVGTLLTTNETAFIHSDNKEQFLNIKFFTYDSNCQRIKSKQPYYLKSNKKEEKYNKCLFGEHLLSLDKIICLVESEKSAIIASWFYPQFDWLATGSANGLTDEKMSPLFNRQIYYFPDADKGGRNNSTIKKFKEYEIDHDIIDLFLERNDGYDIADAIIDGIKPVISNIPNKSNSGSKDNAETENKNKSGPIRPPKIKVVENFLSAKYEIRYNIVDNNLEFREVNGHGRFGILNDNNLFCELQHNHLNFSENKLRALLKSDFVPHYDPIKNYFENLRKWNNKTDNDYIENFCMYIKVQDEVRFSVQFRKMLVRCIACALDANVFNKHAFVLVGQQQHTGKSTLLRWLSPQSLLNYYTETLVQGKDAEMSLSDNFIINLDELSVFSKHEINSLKSAMSRLFIRQRRPYDRNNSNFPRRANFFASTNNSEFLTDYSGNVRWLCFEIFDINWNYNKELNIDDLWRQAYSLYKSGYDYQLSKGEIEENEKANTKHVIESIEVDLLQNYFLPGTKEEYDLIATTTEILQYLQRAAPDLKNQLSINKIGKALSQLKFSKGQKMSDHYQVKGYYLKEKKVK